MPARQGTDPGEMWPVLELQLNLVSWPLVGFAASVMKGSQWYSSV
jgi:hypothetical protein